MVVVLCEVVKDEILYFSFLMRLVDQSLRKYCFWYVYLFYYRSIKKFMSAELYINYLEVRFLLPLGMVTR